MRNETKTYEKPNLKFVNIRNEQAVANTCWGGSTGASGGGVWYYDVTGNGYVKFEMTGGACRGSQAYNIVYYDHNGQQGTVTSEMITELNNTLAAAAGNAGTPWKGERDGRTPLNPDPAWS